MSWLKKIFKTEPSRPNSPDEVIAKVEGLATLISSEVEANLSTISKLMPELNCNPMMGEKEQASALESVYWAITLLRLIQKSELGYVPQAWIPDLLNQILSEMESEKRGCKVRFARQMLQEYAEIQVKQPEKSYQKDSMLDYFRAWLWECLKKADAQRPETNRLSCFDPVIEPFLNKEDLWT